MRDRRAWRVDDEIGVICLELLVNYAICKLCDHAVTERAHDFAIKFVGIENIAYRARTTAIRARKAGRADAHAIVRAGVIY